MSLQEQLHQYLEAAERQMRENERSLGEFRKLQPRLAEMVGEGFGAEGKIRVSWTQAGLADLEFDPRALRLTSDILARETKAAIREAQDNLSSQMMELINEAGLQVPEMPDPQEAERQMAKMRTEMMSAFNLGASELDQAARLREQQRR